MKTISQPRGHGGADTLNSMASGSGETASADKRSGLRWSSALLSRSRVQGSLRRLRATEVEILDKMFRCAPVILADQQVLIWQATRRIMPVSELIGRWGTAVISLAADGLAQVEPRLEGFESFVPTETCAALVEHALNPVISVIERGAGIPIEFSELQRGYRASLLDDPVEVGFVVYERDLKPVVRGYVRAPADCWRSFELDRLPTLTTRRHLAVPVRLGMQIGCARMRLGDLKGLTQGDALRICKRSDDGNIRISLVDRLGKPVLKALIANELLVLEYPMTSTSDFSTASATETPETDIPTEDILSAIECDITFELGSIRLPVSEVARLRAGQAIRLGLRLQDQPVSVMVNGRAVARGELAALGDELVVVITDTSRLPHV